MAKSETISINIAARDVRFLRAAEKVLKDYKIVRRAQQEKGLVVFDITGGQTPYVVTVHPEWGSDPACTCPDASKQAKACTHGYCKHVIAVLLSNEDLRGQLLEVFI